VTLDDLRIGASEIHGRGVFATRGFAPGDTVERCPVIDVPATERDRLDQTALHDYYFKWQDGGAALALGYGSLYNHSPSHNGRYVKDFDANVVAFVAVVAISPGEEITVDYTDAGRNELWFDV
jgi:SET domain-containing protein